MAKFDSPQNRHPLTDHKLTCHRWLCRRPLRLCQIWCKSVNGRGLVGNGWDIIIFKFIYLYPFSWSHLQVKPVNGFSHLMAQSTLTRVTMCFLGFRWYCSPFRGEIPPPRKPIGRHLKNPHNRDMSATVWPIFTNLVRWGKICLNRPDR